MRIRFADGYNGKSDIVKEKYQISIIFSKSQNSTNLISLPKKKFYLDSRYTPFIPQENPICNRTDTPHDKTVTVQPFERWFKFFELQNDVFKQSCSILDGICLDEEIFG